VGSDVQTALVHDRKYGLRVTLLPRCLEAGVPIQRVELKLRLTIYKSIVSNKFERPPVLGLIAGGTAFDPEVGTNSGSERLHQRTEI
jgi:hypothetical protein